MKVTWTNEELIRVFVNGNAFVADKCGCGITANVCYDAYSWICSCGSFVPTVSSKRMTYRAPDLGPTSAEISMAFETFKRDQNNDESQLYRRR